MNLSMQHLALYLLASLILTLPVPIVAASTINVATTTVTLSICGNAIVDGGEECDVPGETGVYSTTIAGRQCTAVCEFGPYCGDGILQTAFDEECDDGNNDDGDFCSSICKIEPAGSGGGGSSGGGSRSGGSNRELSDTMISVVGRGYPRQTINILLDTVTIGSVRADGDGDFDFSTDADPGTASMGFWSEDSRGTRSITLNTTFDVTQGAVTNINGIIIPPTVRIPDATVDPGDVVTISGQAVPEATIEIHRNDSEEIYEATTDADGEWSFTLDTGTLAVAEHTLKARSVSGDPPLTTESNFSSSLQLFVGVDGQPTTASDLNRDGSVNLTDFSILVFWWGTAGGDSDPPADINGNGNVGLEDFSILLFNWTG